MLICCGNRTICSESLPPNMNPTEKSPAPLVSPAVDKKWCRILGSRMVEGNQYESYHHPANGMIGAAASVCGSFRQSHNRPCEDTWFLAADGTHCTAALCDGGCMQSANTVNA